MIAQSARDDIPKGTCSLSTLLLGHEPRRIHLIGVAGSGMSGIAALLLALGHHVTGSDKVETQEVERLRRKGLQFETPHGTQLVGEADLVIYSSAIHAGNPALDMALSTGKRLARRAEVLAAIMTGKEGIVVCGMHGKTTTSAMAAHVLRAGGLKPSHYVGAEIPILGTNARWVSEGAYFVAEGDESDGTLVHYHPRHALVLNIEPEHLDHYRDIREIDMVFTQLLNQTSGNIYYWADDEGAARVCADHRQAVPVGTGEHSQYRISGLEENGFATRFAVFKGRELLGSVNLGISGIHNASNAMLVIALACDLGIPFGAIAAALESFRGAKRRFELKHSDHANRIFDDYGHHPTEIQATLATARKGVVGKGRLVVLFQPHRFTRTAALREQFGRAFRDADVVFVAPIYSAGENPIEGVGPESIVMAAKADGHPSINCVASLREGANAAVSTLREGDLLLTLGAGNVHEAASFLAEELQLGSRIMEVLGSGVLKYSEPLSRHTTMRVGGPARFWVEPETEEGLSELVRFCHDGNIPFMIMGRGSNLIVRDGGFPGVVAHLVRGCFSEYRVEGNRITAGVGVKLKQLASTARHARLTGFEWMDGIPGNLGGALRMNAGAMGVQTFEQVESIRFSDRDGNIISRTVDEMEIQYREIPLLRDHFALSATLLGSPDTIDSIDERLSSSLKHRKESQPIAASSGCIFKNPEGISAGRLIDELGLKNTVHGGARVSDLHANFIVNEGGATASDILELIRWIKSEALERRGIQLETEVSIIGMDKTE